MADETFKKEVTEIFRTAFPKGYVDVSEGYHNRLHVLVISRDFDGMTEREKQARLWEIADQKLGEKTPDISLLIGYSPDELK